MLSEHFEPKLMKIGRIELRVIQVLKVDTQNNHPVYSRLSDGKHFDKPFFYGNYIRMYCF